MKHPAALRTLLVIAALVILLDQITKYAMLEWVGIATRPPITLTGWFKLVMVWNHGISFGMLSAPESAMPYFLIAMALIISAVLVGLCMKSHRRLEWVGYALIVGGALGNVIDRVRFGAVADFFYLHIGPYGWPAFNVAPGLGCCCFVHSFCRVRRLEIAESSAMLRPCAHTILFL
jgi:signal peptidase II